MTAPSEPAAVPRPATSQEPGEYSGLPALAVLLTLAGLALAGYGVYVMYHYDETQKIVGGDAYNFQILATRGAGLITAGLTTVAAGIVSAVGSLHRTIRGSFGR